MQSHVERALAAIEAAEVAVAAIPSAPISAEHWRLIHAAKALPENQDGADKSWVWPAYEFCRGHFAAVRPR